MQRETKVRFMTNIYNIVRSVWLWSNKPPWHWSVEDSLYSMSQWNVSSVCMYTIVGTPQTWNSPISLPLTSVDCFVCCSRLFYKYWHNPNWYCKSSTDGMDCLLVGAARKRWVWFPIQKSRPHGTFYLVTPSWWCQALE